MAFVRKFLALSLPFKLLVGSVLGAIAGPGLIGFLSEYAAYAYALSIGIRPPLEGIPYLRATVTTISLATAMIATLLFFASRFVVAAAPQTIWSLSRGFLGTLNISREQTVEFIRKKGAFPAFAFSIAISGILGSFAYFFAKHIPELRLYEACFGFLFGAYFFVATLTLWSNKATWFVAIAAVLLF